MSSKGVNKVILVGNCGKDPELKYSVSGFAFAHVTIATSESWKDKQTGQLQEKTEWHRVVFKGKLADIVGEWVKKGQQLYVEGKLETRKWQGNDGVDKYSTEIVVNGFDGSTMQMLGGKPQGQQPQQRPQQQAAPQNNSPAEDFDDDIPF